MLHADTFLGRVARAPLRLVRRGSVVPILATAARGKKWICGSGPHSNWLGFNELAKRRVFARHVQTGLVVYDVGANVGSYTILAACLVGRPGQVVAFEPLPENVEYLQRHVSINRLCNVEIVPKAVSDFDGDTWFEPTTDRVLGQINPHGSIRVPCITLDGVVAGGRVRKPDCIKIDVEGGEAAVLRGALRLLETYHPVVFVATHGAGADKECRAILSDRGYSIGHIRGHADELIGLFESRERNQD
jgi:FkbM family methyltransferase